MELGNMIFGNSRGEYDITGKDCITNGLYELFEHCSPLEDDPYVHYENDTFFTMPYYWGECECGFEEKAEKWHRTHKHEPNCYQTLVKNEKKKYGWKEDEYGYLHVPDYYDYTTIERIENKIYKKYCEKFNLPFPHGCAVHCTCKYKKLEEEFYKHNDHDPYCKVVVPNFIYKPLGLEIKWYKYPGRDSYANKEITCKEFREIINNCIDSVKKDMNEVYKYVVPIGKYKNISIGDIMKLEEGRKYLSWIAYLDDNKEMQAKYHISNNLIKIVRTLVGIKEGQIYEKIRKAEERNEVKRS